MYTCCFSLIKMSTKKDFYDIVLSFRYSLRTCSALLRILHFLFDRDIGKDLHVIFIHVRPDMSVRLCVILLHVCVCHGMYI
jgi:hypothetical protein